MNSKITRLQNFKDYIRDTKIYIRDSFHDFLRHKVKVGYKTQPEHEFIPDQSKLGMHLAIIDPDSFIVEDIMTTDPKFGGLLKLRPLFVEISHSDRNKIKIGEGTPWVYNLEDNTYTQLEKIEGQEQ